MLEVFYADQHRSAPHIFESGDCAESNRWTGATLEGQPVERLRQWIDGRHMGAGQFSSRFPTVFPLRCRCLRLFGTMGAEPPALRIRVLPIEFPLTFCTSLPTAASSSILFFDAVDAVPFDAVQVAHRSSLCCSNSRTEMSKTLRSLWMREYVGSGARITFAP